jgi:hypothetical protein
MNEKREFLVSHDYGMGGVWAVINARSPEEITQKYPMLGVQTQRPDWMTDDVYKRIAAGLTLDIDDPPTGWLHILVSGLA